MEQSKYFSPLSKGSIKTKTLVWTIIGIFLVVASITIYAMANYSLIFQPQKQTGSAQVDFHGMSKYSDLKYGFYFWYPSQLQITKSVTRDSLEFPGGVAVETLQVGPAGGASIILVDSPNGTITDEPKNHASPIDQTKYFYDKTSNKWMVAFPEGTNSQSSGNTTLADISKTTMSGLIMLSSSKRFDTTIIPLGTTRFLVVSDGGGSSFTAQLAKTVSINDSTVDAFAQESALKDEADAYAKD